jgi:hypothetical protein
VERSLQYPIHECDATTLPSGFMLLLFGSQYACVYACVCVCVRACMRVCMRVCA